MKSAFASRPLPVNWTALVAYFLLSHLFSSVRPLLTIPSKYHYTPHELKLPARFRTSLEAWGWIKTQLGGQYSWRDVDFSQATLQDLAVFPEDFYQDLLTKEQMQFVHKIRGKRFGADSRPRSPQYSSGGRLSVGAGSSSAVADSVSDLSARLSDENSPESSTT